MSHTSHKAALKVLKRGKKEGSEVLPLVTKQVFLLHYTLLSGLLVILKLLAPSESADGLVEGEPYNHQSSAKIRKIHHHGMRAKTNLLKSTFSDRVKSVSGRFLLPYEEIHVVMDQKSTACWSVYRSLLILKRKESPETWLLQLKMIHT